MQLRDYQVAGIERARDRMRAGVRRLCLVLPTGGGKTVVAADIIASAVRKSRRALFLAHRRELLYQTRNKLLDAGLTDRDVGLILADEKRLYRPHAPVQVASVATLVRRQTPPADLVFVDEAHHSAAASYRMILSAYPGATILGLTATPVRDDGKGLNEQFDELLLLATPRELMAAGYLATPRVFSSKEKLDLSEVSVRGGDYVPGELGRAMDKPRLVGDLVQHWTKLGHDRRTVVFATSVEHSRSIVEAFNACGAIAEHLDGETPKDEREAILARLAAGTTEVVSNCCVLTEGWDLPSCKTIILARPTRALGLYLQMAGRGLRPWEGVAPILLDHGECVERHGFPQDDRDWTAYFEGKKRGGGGEAPVKSCPACFAVVPCATKVCPECGAPFPIAEREGPDHVDGELVERTSPQESPLEARRRWYLGKLTYARSSGREVTWARGQYKDRFNEWPRFYREEWQHYPETAPTPKGNDNLPDWLRSQLQGAAP